jgi:hypothetical protein
VWLLGLITFGTVVYKYVSIRYAFIDLFGTLNIGMIIFWPIVVFSYIFLYALGWSLAVLMDLGQMIYKWVRHYNYVISGRRQ